MEFGKPKTRKDVGILNFRKNVGSGKYTRRMSAEGPRKDFGKGKTVKHLCRRKSRKGVGRIKSVKDNGRSSL